MSQPQPVLNPAQTYEDYFVPAMFRPWADELIERAQPQPGERILDIACGSGIVARLIAQRLAGQATISGLDMSPAMIEVAKSASAREGTSIDWHIGSADALPFTDDTFDLVLIQHGLQFFPDRPAALREVHRVVASGGRVATATWLGPERHPYSKTMAEAIERHLGASATGGPLSLGDADELRRLFNEAGFVSVRIDCVGREVRYPSPDRYLELTMASRAAAVPAMQAMDATERAQLVAAVREELAELIRQHTVGDAVVVPFEAHITVAHKAGQATDR